MRTAVNQLTVDNVPTSASYSDELNEAIRRLAGSSNLTLRQLALQMEGAYPTDLLAAVNTLNVAGIEVTLAEEPSDSTQLSKDQLVSRIQLPEPHPIDYDWRFRVESLLLFSQLLADMEARRIAILGAPTLFLHLANAGLQPCLYDKNCHLVEALRSVGLSSANCCNLFETHFEDPNFDAVIADPPWYPEHYASFIRNSADLLMPCGVLFLSVLPRLTRPSAAQDRMAIIRIAYENGLDLIAVHQSALAYDSPPFEQESLRAEGISLNNWRRGDLFIFKRNTRVREESVVPVIEDDSRWTSFSIGRTIVKVKNRNSDSSRVEFGALSPSGDVHLHSVSRRAPFRSGIDVWTSRNLALWVSRPDYLCEILVDRERGRTVHEAISRIAEEKQLDLRSTETLRQLLNLLEEDGERAGNG